MYLFFIFSNQAILVVQRGILFVAHVVCSYILFDRVTAKISRSYGARTHSIVPRNDKLNTQDSTPVEKWCML